MDLWIRSQDRTELVKCSRIKIEENFETKDGITTTDYTIYNFDGVHINHLGRYKPKERALQVLDDIQNRLYTRIMVNEYTGKNADLLYSKETQLKVIPDTTLYANPININTSVYEMPKE